MVSNKATFSKLYASQNNSPTTLSVPASNVTLVKPLLQNGPPEGPLPLKDTTSSNDFGISISISDLQSRNACTPSFCKFLDKLTSLKFVQPENAKVPIAVTVSGIVTAFNDVFL